MKRIKSRNKRACVNRTHTTKCHWLCHWIQILYVCNTALIHLLFIKNLYNMNSSEQKMVNILKEFYNSNSKNMIGKIGIMTILCTISMISIFYWRYLRSFCSFWNGTCIVKMGKLKSINSIPTFTVLHIYCISKYA